MDERPIDTVIKKVNALETENQRLRAAMKRAHSYLGVNHQPAVASEILYSALNSTGG